MKSIEVCISPAILDRYINAESVAVVIDVFRATTSITTAFENGAAAIIPVETTEEARRYSEEGVLVAGEREGIKLPFADFGNSPDNFTPERVSGRRVVYTTTNGTRAIMMTEPFHTTLIGSFLNASAVAERVVELKRDVVILCAGWKDKFNIEDTLCAGLISGRLLDSGLFATSCDSANASVDLYRLAKGDINGYIKKAAQNERLIAKGLGDCIGYCLRTDISAKVPELSSGVLRVAGEGDNYSGTG